jgi:hypothetical protein
MTRQPRPRKCRTCRQPFKPANTLQSACSIPCAIAQGRKQMQRSQDMARRQQRRETAERKVKLRTRRDWIKRAQIAFNAYIRARDAGKTCICCDRPLNPEAIGGGYDCGHYRSVGSAPHLRFEPENAHGQTKQCNRYGAGRAVDYRLGLIRRIGLARVEAIEADQLPRKWTIAELQDIERHYKALTKELKR